MGKIYAYDNPYSRQRIPKKDIATTRRIKKKYTRVASLEKFLQKKWPRVFDPVKTLFMRGLNAYKKRIHYDFLQAVFTRNYTNSNDYSTCLQEAKLNSLCVYDILPKEQLSDFEKGIRKFYYRYNKHGNILYNDFRSFSLMQTKNNHGLYYLLTMSLDSNIDISKYVDDIFIFAEEMDQAFYVITYSLILSNAATEKAREILATQFFNEPLFSLGGESLSSYEKYDFFGANIAELENFLLGLKHQFFKTIDKDVPTFFYKKGIMPPHLINVESKGTPKDKLLELFSFNVLKNEQGKVQNSDYDYKDGFFCNLGFASYNKSFMHDHAIVFDSSIGPTYKYFACELAGYHVQLGKIFVGEVITKEIDKLIVKEQTRINKTLERRLLTTQSMLKTRLKAYQNIYLFRRLEKALLESLKSDNGMHGALKGFQNDYRSLRPDVLQDENGILYHRRMLVYKMERQLINIDSLFEVFDVKLKLFESSSNIRLIRWTFILTIVSIIVSLLALLDSAGIVDLTGLWSLIFRCQ